MSGEQRFRGQPRGQTLASSPRRFAVRCCQRGSPKGGLRFTLGHSASGSLPNSTPFTQRVQPLPLARGPSPGGPSRPLSPSPCGQASR
jgi:hypothetical protein